MSIYLIRTEARLLNALRQRQAEVIDQYGEIIEETGSSDTLGIGTDLCWKVRTLTTDIQNSQKNV